MGAIFAPNRSAPELMHTGCIKENKHSRNHTPLYLPTSLSPQRPASGSSSGGRRSSIVTSFCRRVLLTRFIVPLLPKPQIHFPLFVDRRMKTVAYLGSPHETAYIAR